MVELPLPSRLVWSSRESASLWPTLRVMPTTWPVDGGESWLAVHVILPIVADELIPQEKQVQLPKEEGRMLSRLHQLLQGNQQGSRGTRQLVRNAGSLAEPQTY